MSSFRVDDIADLDDVNVSLPPNDSRRESNANVRLTTQQNSYNYTNEPIQLIDFSKGFKVNTKALELLNSIKEDIIVVSVVGKARTGKSYLMNLLLDLVGKDENGFRVASTLSSCTKGIWLWNNVKTSINSNAKILFLDSEGTSSTDKSTKTYDSRIFALVVLISSLFLYNTYSNIDEHGISELSLAAHLSNAITTNSEINKDELLTELSPKFIWIIRDFTLEKVHPETGEEISSKEYLELCLKNKRCGKNANDNNLIRQNIIKFFPDRDCVSLVRPVDKESDLKKLNSIPFNKLKADFKIEFKKLKDKIYKEATPKKYNGKRLNGPGLACLIEEFVKTINSGKIPNINNSWDSIIEKDINDAYSKAILYYKNQTAKLNVSQNKVYGTSELLKKLYKIQYQSYGIYNELMRTNADTFNHKNYSKMFYEMKKKLTSQINQMHNKLMEQNASNSQTQCQNTLVDKYHVIEDKLYNNIYKVKTLSDLEEDYGTFLNEYNDSTKGDKKVKSLFNFIITKEKSIVDYLTELMIKESERSYRKFDKNLKEAQAEIDNVTNNRRVADTKEKMNKDKIDSLEIERKKLYEEVLDLQDTLKMKKEQLKKMREVSAACQKNKATLEENIQRMDSRARNRRGREAGPDGNCSCKCIIF